MLTLEQKSEVYEAVEKYVAMGNEALGIEMPVPHVRFDKRGTTAGTAHLEAHEVNYNAQILLDNWDEFMARTVPHEVAHLLKHTKYGSVRGNGGINSHHGLYWKQIMRMLGADPSRCHSMDTTNSARTTSPKRQHLYKCEGCESELVISSVRHNRMLRGTRSYSHCRGHKLKYLRPLGQMTYREAAQEKSAPTKPKNTANRPGIIDKKPAPVAKKTVKAPKPGTKIYHATLIYNEMRKTTDNRQDIISAIANSMQITKHQAAGYYQTCKKRIG
jgi:SprT protein